MNYWDIEIYQLPDGKAPFDEWIDSLDETIRARVFARLDRVRLGNFGSHKNVGGGVFELKFFFGSGYRIYFGKTNDRIVLLLSGGDKKSQTKDMRAAKLFWKDYLAQKRKI